MTSRPLRSSLGWSTPSEIYVYGRDLPGELLGTIDFGGMTYLALTGAMPTPPQARMFNTLLVTLVEHGQTPSSIATRMTFLGAPESLQAAVAAGLLGLGSVFVGSIGTAAEMLSEAVAESSAGTSGTEVTERVVERFLSTRVPLPGIGHPKHKPIDPRTPRLFDIARETEQFGAACQMMHAIQATAEAKKGRALPINATGAIAAIAVDLGLTPLQAQGLGIIARSAGLVAHAMEEMREPIAREIWERIDGEVTEGQLAQRAEANGGVRKEGGGS
ncbi:citryl-CoA lyase [Streptomyces sp. NPDC002758]